MEKDNCNCGHNHEDPNHECGCNEDDFGVDFNFLNLQLDDGRELKCSVLGTFEALDDEYIALLPEDSEDVLIYSFDETEDGLNLKAIETEDEFDQIAEVFMDLYGEENFEE